MKAILQVDEGFLVACKEYKPKSEMRLLLFDIHGTIMREWRESTGNLFRPLTFSLHHTADGIFLIAGGQDSERKSVTIIRKIVMPSA